MFTVKLTCKFLVFGAVCLIAACFDTSSLDLFLSIGPPYCDRRFIRWRGASDKHLQSNVFQKVYHFSDEKSWALAHTQLVSECISVV